MNLLIRADAGTIIGQGHLTRCLALAYAWRDSGGHAEFLSHCEGTRLKERIIDEGFHLSELQNIYPQYDEDLSRTLVRAAQMQQDSGSRDATWVVLSGNNFDEHYQKAIRQGGSRLLVIQDSVRLKRYYADAILNQNIFAEDLFYPCAVSASLLLGAEYALIRPEFRRWQGWHRNIDSIGRRILIFMGAGDSQNATLKMIQAVQQLESGEVEARVVIGSINPHKDQLEKSIFQARQKYAGPRIELLEDVTDMADLMAWADLAVAAAGSISWELCFMGLPSVLIFFDPEQQEVAKGLDRAKASLNFGSWNRLSLEDLTRTVGRLLNDSDLRRRMSEISKTIVDGNGASRVVRALQNWQSRDGQMQPRLSLRAASISDLEILLEWRNDPLTRSASHNSNEVPLTEHREWLTRALSNPDQLVYVVEEDAIPVGVVRADFSGGEHELSWTVAPAARGRGLGKHMVGLLANQIEGPIRAAIKAGNSASERIAEAAGMRLAYERNGIMHYKRPSKGSRRQ